MILYHGSNVKIASIDLSRSKPNKDFGKAFYVSEDRERAAEMAAFKSAILGGEAVVTELSIDSFEGLIVKRFEDYSEEWAHFVFEHRNEPSGKTLHNYDVVYGPIANINQILSIGFAIRIPVFSFRAPATFIHIWKTSYPAGSFVNESIISALKEYFSSQPEIPESDVDVLVSFERD